MVICQLALRAPLFSCVPFLFDKPLNSELVNESSENAPWNCYPRGISFTLLQRGSFGKSLFYCKSREREKKADQVPGSLWNLLVSVDRIICSADCLFTVTLKALTPSPGRKH